MIFLVEKGLKQMQKVDASSFVDLDIWERKHLEEWVRQSPEVLGEDLLVVSMEFDRFKGSSDRLDLLAVDRAGNLVVIELKRDSYAGYADLQAVRYAAMVSSMTIDQLLPYYIDYQRKVVGLEEVSEEKSRENIVEFIEADDLEDLSSDPRIILCSENFSQEITTTVLWLREHDVDISCVRVTPHVLEDKVIIVPNKIIPLDEAKQYMIDIQEKEEKRSQRRTVRPRSMRVLIENRLVSPGDKIVLKHDLPKHLEFDEKDPTFFAEITGKLGRSNAVIWKKDGKEYSISKLTWNIFRDLHPERKDPGGINGNWHWMTEAGETLWDMAERWRQESGGA